MNLNISKHIKTVQNVVTAHSPVLLMGTAMAGVITTGVLAARAGYKARGVIDEAVVEKGEPLTLQEQVQKTWLLYTLPSISGLSSIAATFGLHAVHSKRQAALAGLYAVATGKLDDYAEEAEQMLGAKKTQELNNRVAQKAVDGDPIVNNEVIITSEGTELFHDDFSGRFFTSSVVLVETAVNDANRQIIDEGEIDLNAFYDLLGLNPVPLGTDLGWSGQQRVSVRFGAVNTPEGGSAVSFFFHSNPKPNLGKSK